MPKELFLNSQSDKSDNPQPYSSWFFLMLFAIIIEIFIASIILFIILLPISSIVYPKILVKSRKKPSQSPKYYPYPPDNLPSPIVSKLFITYARCDNDEYISSEYEKNNSFFLAILDMADKGIISL